jgi:predicted transcriptional regulator/transcriptional regulator with XRE-family HTH domain
MARKALMGNKIRRLRQSRGLTQSDLAGRLGISGSYLNLIEHNRRAVTVPLLLKLAEALQADLAVFGRDDEARLVSDLSEVFADAALASREVGSEELSELAHGSPAVARSILDLYRAYRQARDDGRALAERLSDGSRWSEGGGDRPPPEEEVSDFIQQHLNHFTELESAAEELGREAGLSEGAIDRHLIEYLQREHGIEVEVVASHVAGGVMRRFDPEGRRLVLSEVLAPRSRSFQLAHQIALVAHRPLLDRLAGSARFSTDDGRALARVALANYFAGAVLMPYSAFLEAARAVRYDVELLGHRFRTSFEQVCHRLTTLRRPGQEGVPFHFLRVDIAGNISKRFTASARYGGSCPRWNVYTAFLSPGFIRTQLSRMPDGRTYFCIARTVRKEAGGFRVPQTRLAIGLGCEVGHARELVYADGIDLSQLEAAVPIGTSCRLCERMDCSQRAFPPLQHSLNVEENLRGLSFYAWAAPRPGGA